MPNWLRDHAGGSCRRNAEPEALTPEQTGASVGDRDGSLILGSCAD